jgi:benzylsuccinate CoA-transferase BbsF subunit
VFRSAGHERYIAIAVESAGQWEALCALAPLEDFADARYRELPARRADRVPIEASLATWCADADAFDLADALRAAGVPAYAVLRPSDLAADSQLAHRGFFVTVDHSVMGPMRVDGPATLYSRTPAYPRTAAPALGEHGDSVLRELLGLSADEITELAIAGALS